MATLRNSRYPSTLNAIDVERRRITLTFLRGTAQREVSCVSERSSEQETITTSLYERAIATAAFLFSLGMQIYPPYDVSQHSGVLPVVGIALVWFPILVLTSLWFLTVCVRAERLNTVNHEQ